MNMTVFPLLAVSFIMNVAAALFIICAVILVLVILVQKGKGGGLSGAISGGAVGGILGTQTKGPMTWITIFLACVFLMLAVFMAKFYKPAVSEAGSEQPVPLQQQMPVQPVPPQGSALPFDVGELGTDAGDQSPETDLPSN